MRVVFASLAVSAVAFAAPAQVTYYKDALPVLQNNCQGCHRPGEPGPMSFMSYETTRPAAKAIKEAVLSKKMPPWFADPAHGKFANDRSLSQADIKTLVSWVDGGAKAGDPKDAPKPIAFTQGWVIGVPDKVFEIPTAVAVPASGTIDYQYVVMHSGLTEDKYVQFAEARPTDREHTHHIIAFIREPGNPWMKDAPIGVAFVPSRNGKGEDGGGQGEFLAGYAPGMVAPMLKPGQAKLLKAGSDIIFQLHYTADGKVGSDKSKVGIVYSKVKPTERIVTLAAANPRFAIPPGDSNYRVDSKIVLQDDATLTMMLPHMHLRGKDFEYRAIYPDGTKEILLDVPHYSFSWQLSYFLAEPKKLPAGTIIEGTAHFDNSVNNKDNPDATKEIHFGEQSWDEMMIGFFDVAIPLDKTPMDLMRPKKAKTNTGAAQQ
jgi:mono/diheme cytochrome c family protein